MSTSRGNVEDVYESQNDQRLDELHTKLRTLRGVRNDAQSSLTTISNFFPPQVTTDIHRDVEAQNLILDETVWVPCYSSTQAIRERLLSCLHVREIDSRLLVRSWRRRRGAPDRHSALDRAA
jgi:hypothetical protein